MLSFALLFLSLAFTRILKKNLKIHRRGSYTVGRVSYYLTKRCIYQLVQSTFSQMWKIHEQEVKGCYSCYVCYAKLWYVDWNHCQNRVGRGLHADRLPWTKPLSVSSKLLICYLSALTADRYSQNGTVFLADADASINGFNYRVSFISSHDHIQNAVYFYPDLFTTNTLTIKNQSETKLLS